MSAESESYDERVTKLYPINASIQTTTEDIENALYKENSRTIHDFIVRDIFHEKEIMTTDFWITPVHSSKINCQNPEEIKQDPNQKYLLSNGNACELAERNLARKQAITLNTTL